LLSDTEALLHLTSVGIILQWSPWLLMGFSSRNKHTEIQYVFSNTQASVADFQSFLMSGM